MSVFSLNSGQPEILSPDGTPFFTFGVNYEGYFDRAWAMWRPNLFDLDLIERDFAKARASGFNTVRLFVQKENHDEVNRGEWQRFDAVIGLAERYNLAVMLTFNDAHLPHLAQVGEFNAKIAAHFRGHQAIHSWDLENEPRLYNLLVANYPNGTCPLLTSALIDHYGELIPRSKIDMNRIPGLLRGDANKAYYYRNAVEAYIRFGQQAMTSGMPSIVDFMFSEQGAAWRQFFKLLNDTIAAWLAPQMEPMKAADPQRLFSVGWNWEALAALPANRALDFHQIHKYGKTVGYTKLNNIFSMLKALQRVFPTQPIIMGEFGYSTDESETTDTHKPVDPRITALHEAAMMCFLRAEGFSGGIKWMLNDVRNAPNPFEAGLGVYADGDRPKPVRRIFEHLASLWRQTDDLGQLRVLPDHRTHVRVHYLCESGGFSGGGGDESPVAWDANAPAMVLTTCDASGQIRVETDAPLQVSLTLPQLSARWHGAQAAVYRLEEEGFSPEGIQSAVSVQVQADAGSPRLISPL